MTSTSFKENFKCYVVVYICKIKSDAVENVYIWCSSYLFKHGSKGFLPMALPNKIVDSVAKFANKKGRWSLTNFNYTSWLEISDRLLESNLEDAYTIKALTYYTNGELSNFLEYATKLFEISKQPSTFNIYLTAVHTNGKIEDTIKIFDEYIDSLSSKSTIRFLLSNHITYARYGLDNHTLEKNYEKFQDILDDKIRGFMLNTIRLNNRDLEILKFAGIEKALFLEVMGVAIQTLSEIGNFITGYRIHARQPNDDLTISIHGELIDIEIMHDLNEAWLDKIVDHESTYDFDQLSRVLVNFQPSPNTNEEVYVH